MEDNNGNMVCAGYYSDDYKTSSTNGVFIAKVDPSGSVSRMHKGHYEFPVEILKQFEKGRTQDKIDKKDKKD